MDSLSKAFPPQLGGGTSSLTDMPDLDHLRLKGGNMPSLEDVPNYDPMAGLTNLKGGRRKRGGANMPGLEDVPKAAMSGISNLVGGRSKRGGMDSPSNVPAFDGTYTLADVPKLGGSSREERKRDERERDERKRQLGGAKKDHKIVLEAWKQFKQDTKGIKDKMLKMRVKAVESVLKRKVGGFGEGEDGVTEISEPSGGPEGSIEKDVNDLSNEQFKEVLLAAKKREERAAAAEAAAEAAEAAAAEAAEAAVGQSGGRKPKSKKSARKARR